MKDTLDKLNVIEQCMLEAYNLFSLVYNRMGKSTVGIMGFPITLSQLKTMNAFHENVELTMGELCRFAQVKMPTMTEMVDRFEAGGLVTRVRDTGDRRVVKVCLTDKGKKSHKRIMGRREQSLVNMFNELNSRERDDFRRALKKVTATLKKMIEK